VALKLGKGLKKLRLESFSSELILLGGKPGFCLEELKEGLQDGRDVGCSTWWKNLPLRQLRLKVLKKD